MFIVLHTEVFIQSKPIPIRQKLFPKTKTIPIGLHCKYPNTLPLNIETIPFGLFHKAQDRLYKFCNVRSVTITLSLNVNCLKLEDIVSFLHWIIISKFEL